MNNICVIIPMFGKEEYTRKCVDLTLKNAGIPVDIVIVDDCSPDSYEDERVNILRLENNLGFSGAANAGIIYAQKLNYEYIHILNNDTEPFPDFLKVLYEEMEKDKQIGIASSARKMMSDSPYNIELFAADLLRGNQNMTNDLNGLPDLIDVWWVALASAMYRMDMIREIGIFDKRMINWCSDNDICIRARFMGWKVVLVPKSLVLHYHQVTTGKTEGTELEKLVISDQEIFIKKLAGYQYAELMNEMPLDYEKKTYGQIKFDVITR